MVCFIWSTVDPCYGREVGDVRDFSLHWLRVIRESDPPVHYRHRISCYFVLILILDKNPNGMVGWLATLRHESRLQHFRQCDTEPLVRVAQIR